MNRTWMILAVVLLLVAGLGAPASARAVSSDSAPARYVASPSPGAAEAQQALATGLLYVPELPVLLVQDVYPWDFDSNALALAEAGQPFIRITSDELAVTDLSSVRVLIYSSDQPTSYYQNLAANITQISDFVAAGGVLVAHACDGGWSGGSWDGLEILPGGVHHVYYPTDYVHIADLLHPVVAGLDDAYLQGWNASVHGYLVDLLPGTEVVIENDYADPTYIDYAWGAGRVLATTHTIEWGYGDGYNYHYVFRPEFLRNEIRLIGELSSRVLDVGEGLGAAGGLGAVPVDLTDTSGVAGVQFDLLYDYSLLTPVDVIKAPLTSGSDWEFYWNVVEPGRLAVLGFSNTDTELPPGSGAIVQVLFQVDPGAVVGTVTPLYPELIWLSNRTGGAIPVGGADGSLEVGAVDHLEPPLVFPAPPEPQGGDLLDPLPFLVRVEAHHADCSLVTAYNGLAALTISEGAVRPRDIRFVGGVWEGPVEALLDLDPDCTVTVTDAILGVSRTSGPFPVRGKGDVNGDGVVNVLDVVRACNIALERSSIEPPRYEYQFWAADTNRDHVVDIRDVILILRQSLGLPKPTMAVAAAAVTAPVKLSLVEVSRGVWALRASNAAGVAGVQVEIAGQFTGATARDGWQVQSSRVGNHTRLLAFSSGATALPTGEATLLQLTGVRGRPRLGTVTLSDAMGQALAVQARTGK